jgi:transposase-like protein
MDDIMECPYCGSEETEYDGIEMGSNFDDEICDQWTCIDCGSTFDTDCIAAPEPDYGYGTDEL